MNKLIRSAMMMASVGAMLSFAGCGNSEVDPAETVTQKAASKETAALADSAKDVAMKKLQDVGFDKVVFVSEKVEGDESLIIAKVTSDGTTEETKVYCSRIGGKWTVTKLD